MPALDTLPDAQSPKVGKTEKRELAVSRRKSPNQRKYEAVRSREYLLPLEVAFPIHAHMLRHACGYYLAREKTDTRTIQGYLGHKNIQHTVRYTQLSPEPYKGLWKKA